MHNIIYVCKRCLRSLESCYCYLLLVLLTRDTLHIYVTWDRYEIELFLDRASLLAEEAYLDENYRIVNWIHGLKSKSCNFP